jgi:hypothetical protein
MCCALAGLAGCGSSSSSSSSSSTSKTSSTALASAGSTTTSTSTTSSSSTAHKSDTSKDHHRAAADKRGHGSKSSGGAGAAAGSSGASSSSSGSGSTGGPGSTGGSGATSGSASPSSYGSLATFGRSAGGGDKTAVLAAFHSYLTAIGDGNWGAACTLLSSPVKRQLAALLAHSHGIPGHGCAAALGALLGHTPASLRKRQEPTSVAAVRLDGDHAFVLYTSLQFPHASLSMTRESGRWTAGVVAAAGAP